MIAIAAVDEAGLARGVGRNGLFVLSPIAARADAAAPSVGQQSMRGPDASGNGGRSQHVTAGNRSRHERSPAGILRSNQVEIAYPPEAWIRIFGPRLAKVHVKDYQLNADGKGGNWAAIGQGSVNWPAVRNTLDDVGYNGWLADETGLGWSELSHGLDRIIAGEPPIPNGR